MLGEFLSANVSAPWVLFMVQCKNSNLYRILLLICFVSLSYQ